MSDTAAHTGIPPMQIVWTVIYWIAVLPPLFLEVKAISGGAPAYSVVIVALAAAATIIGAIFATRLVRRRLASHWFVKGTTTARVIAVAWVFLGLALYLAPVLDVLLGIDLSGGIANGVLSTVGSVSFLAMLGPGYSEYRDALANIGT